MHFQCLIVRDHPWRYFCLIFKLIFFQTPPNWFQQESACADPGGGDYSKRRETSLKFLFHFFEVAIDSADETVEKRMLKKAERLHKFALNLARKNFGEANVHTAKQYGNLGRLYQTTRMFELSEKMHLKAIEIKEAKLGASDYEVALSIGHLASLYNYDMKKYVEAEQLYLRSIAIGKNLYGPAYSGLEYDYLGLQEVSTHDIKVNVIFGHFFK